MAISGMGGLMIEYDKRKMRLYGYREPEPPKPAMSIDEQIRIMREKWPHQEPTRPPQVQSIILATCRHFDVTRTQLMQRRRLQATVYRRHVAMFVCREMTTASFPEIGRLFGGYDHTSILHAAALIEKRIRVGNQQIIADVLAIRALAITINPTLGED